MMKIKMMMILIAALFILVIFGCKGQTDDAGPITDVEIYKGAEGLVINFLEGSENVFENGFFGVGIEMENKGAADIDDGYLSLALEKDYMEIEEWPIKKPISGSASDSMVNFELLGKSLGRPIGDKYISTFTLKAKALPDRLSESHASSILLSACYGYKTNVFETVCIDTDIYNVKKRDKICAVEDIGLNDQGAPVAVTKIETNILSDEKNEKRVKPRFIISIENKGDGVVVKGNSEVIRKLCSAEPLDYEQDYNKINVRAYLGDTELKCEEAKLKEKTASVRCELEEGIGIEKGTYQAPLKITLGYGYSQTISKDVTIKRVEA